MSVFLGFWFCPPQPIWGGRTIFSKICFFLNIIRFLWNLDWMVVEYVGMDSHCPKSIFPPQFPPGGVNSPQKLFSYLINRFSRIFAWIVSNHIQIDCHCLKFKFKFFLPPPGGGLYPVRGFSDPMDQMSPNLVWILLNGLEIQFHSQKFNFFFFYHILVLLPPPHKKNLFFSVMVLKYFL